MMEIRFDNRLPSRFHAGSDTGQKPTRVAVIGTGMWAGEHARAFAANPFTELVAIHGNHPERTRQRAAALGARPYTNIQVMLESEQPELVSICVRNKEHFALALQVLQAGFPALVEKPFTFELDEARQLLEEAEKRGLFFAIDFNHRYAEPALRAKDLFDQGELGDPVFAAWRFSGNHDFDFEHPFIQLIESGCHGLDLLHHFLGPVASVSAEMTNRTGKLGYGTVALALKFENQAVATVLGSYDASYAYPAANTLELCGTRGRVLCEDTVRRLTFNRVDDPVAQVWQSNYFDDEARYFSGTLDRHIARLIACFRQGQPPPVPARCGYEVLRVTYAAIRSFETGRRVALNEIH